MEHNTPKNEISRLLGEDLLQHYAQQGSVCQVCALSKPVRATAFYQNVGVLVVRFHKTIKGQLCRSCIRKTFWKFTFITFLFGWWSMTSLFITPFFLINNIFRYCMSFGMKSA